MYFYRYSNVLRRLRALDVLLLCLGSWFLVYSICFNLLIEAIFITLSGASIVHGNSLLGLVPTAQEYRRPTVVELSITCHLVFMFFP